MKIKSPSLRYLNKVSAVEGLMFFNPQYLSVELGFLD
jgi:hypothetical protein